jgi:hypothetical protein
VILLLVDIVVDGLDRLSPLTAPPLSTPLRTDLRRLIEQRQGDLLEERLDRVLVAWTHLYGVLNFEVFGRLDDMIEARAEYFDHHMSLMADLTGLPN